MPNVRTDIYYTTVATTEWDNLAEMAEMVVMA